MFANLFQGLFDTDMTSVIAISDFLLCVGSALVVGLILAVILYVPEPDIPKALWQRSLCFLQWSVWLS